MGAGSLGQVVQVESTAESIENATGRACSKLYSRARKAARSRVYRIELALESLWSPQLSTALPKLTACAVEHLGTGRGTGALRSGTLGHTLRE